LRKICIDDAPQNPDELIVQCSNGDCREWMHVRCVAEKALQRAREYTSFVRPRSIADHCPSSRRPSCTQTIVEGPKEEGQTEEPCKQPKHHCGRCRKQRTGHRRSPHQRPPRQTQSRAGRRGRDHHYDRRRRAVLRRRVLSLLRHGGGLILIIHHVAIYALIKTI
jgi:hypothetical protein